MGFLLFSLKVKTAQMTQIAYVTEGNVDLAQDLLPEMFVNVMFATEPFHPN